MRSGLLPLFLCLSLALNACSPQVYIKHVPAPGDKFRVAVLPFKDAPDHPGSGHMATEAFSTHILSVDAYQAIDRTALRQVFEEQKLNMSGAVEQDKAVEIGKLAGAQGVLIGSVAEYHPSRFLIIPAQVALTARLVNTQTGEVEWSAAQAKGGPLRLLSWIVWPLGLMLTLVSPSAEDLVAGTARSICRTVNNLTRSTAKH